MAKVKEKVEEAKVETVDATDLVTEALTGRVKVLEDVLAEVQPALHRFRRQIPNSKVAEDSNFLYMKVRDTLGDKGQEIDKALRG